MPSGLPLKKEESIWPRSHASAGPFFPTIVGWGSRAIKSLRTAGHNYYFFFQWDVIHTCFSSSSSFCAIVCTWSVDVHLKEQLALVPYLQVTTNVPATRPNRTEQPLHSWTGFDFKSILGLRRSAVKKYDTGAFNSRRGFFLLCSPNILFYMNPGIYKLLSLRVPGK